MLKLLHLARIALICATVVACLSIAHAQTQTVVTNYAPGAAAGSGSIMYTVIHPFQTQDDTVTIFNGPEYTDPPENYEITFPCFDPEFDNPPAPHVLTKVRINFSRQRDTFWQFEHLSPNPVTVNYSFKQYLWFTFNEEEYPNGWPWIFVNPAAPTFNLDPEFDIPTGVTPIFFAVDVTNSDSTGQTSYGAFDGTVDFQGPSAGSGVGYGNQFAPQQYDVTNKNWLRRFYRSDEAGNFHCWLSPRGHASVVWPIGQEPAHWDWSNFGWMKVPAISFTYFYE